MRNSITVLAIVLGALQALLQANAAGGETVSLDTLDLTSVQQDWGKAQANKSVDGHPLRIHGRQFSRGIGTHVNSELTIDLRGAAGRFVALAGIDDEAGGRFPEARFDVSADGKSLWSKTLKAGQAAEPIDLPLQGVKSLTLSVTADNNTFGHVDWADARLEVSGGKPQAVVGLPLPPEEAVVATPPPPATPRINGARVFGVRPGHPFLFTIAATGRRPMTFAADGLPAELSLNAQTGIITGQLRRQGECAVMLRAKNALGETARKLRIVVGDRIALTPPLGWNSWNCFAAAVSAEKVRTAADAMVNSGLIQHGWTYINIDDCWEAGRDAQGRILSNSKFPDMKALSDYIHAKGLKVGIYSSPGPKTCAGYEASWQHEDLDARRYAEWGVDYVKYDWCSYGQIAQERTAQRYAEAVGTDPRELDRLMHQKAALERNRKRSPEQNARLKELRTQLAATMSRLEPEKKQRIEVEIFQEPYRVFRGSLDKVERDIVFSFCQYGMGNVWEWGERLGGNSWRTTGDITDTWSSMAGIGFKQAGHERYAGPGHWNDPDMLVVGQVGWGPRLHPTRLTPSEQTTHISLWCLLCAPLLIGCDMADMDPFTLSLLTNDEVLEVSQDPLGSQAAPVWRSQGLEVWAKPLEDGSKAVGLFNRNRTPESVTARFADLGVSGKQIVRDLWWQQDLGRFENQFQAKVAPHGVVLVRIRAAR